MSRPHPAWFPQLERALAAGDRDALVAIPKTDLHCHGLLSAPLATFEAVRARSLPPPPKLFGDFDNFTVYIIEHLFPALSDPSAVRAIIRGAFERLAADGVVYAEMSFDLLLPESIGLSAEQFAALLGAEMARIADRVRVAPEIGINRVLPAGDLTERVHAWLDTGVFRSIDLYGDERLGQARDFAPLYELAGARGLKRKAHAGELCGAERVRESVEVLQLDAVHHGVRAADDPETTAWLAERGTVLHVCPTSNYALGVCESLAAHPARRLYDQGVALTVNTDDFTLFGASVCDELLNLSQIGFSADEIAHMIETGLAEQAEK
jgi:adenosine deaminase